MSPHDMPTLVPSGDGPACNSCAVYEAMARRAQSALFDERQHTTALSEELLSVTMQLDAANANLADRRADCDAMRRVVERLSAEHDPQAASDAAENAAPTWAPTEMP
jgi:hypothetical protein